MNAAVVGAACAASFVLGALAGVLASATRRERERWRRWARR